MCFIAMRDFLMHEKKEGQIYMRDEKRVAF